MSSMRNHGSPSVYRKHFIKRFDILTTLVGYTAYIIPLLFTPLYSVDLRKAFDMFDHTILLKRLDLYGMLIVYFLIVCFYRLRSLISLLVTLFSKSKICFILKIYINSHLVELIHSVRCHEKYTLIMFLPNKEEYHFYYIKLLISLIMPVSKLLLFMKRK